MLTRIHWRITAPPLRRYSALPQHTPPPQPSQPEEPQDDAPSSSTRPPSSSSSRYTHQHGIGLRRTSVISDAHPDSPPLARPPPTRASEDGIRRRRELRPRDWQQRISLLRRALRNSNFKHVKDRLDLEETLLETEPGLQQVLLQPTALEQHTILNDLVRKGKVDLATTVLLALLADLSYDRPPRFRSQTLATVVGARPPERRYAPRRTFTPIPKHLPLEQPTLEEQQPPPVPKPLNDLHAVVRQLQAIHHPRPSIIYHILIQEALGAVRPDIAADVFVELVEEWIMEGRLAEGAKLEDFYGNHKAGVHGKLGVPVSWPPPKDAAANDTSRSSLLGIWFSGVRTWRLPGEALSLHERLDLWHPRGHAPDQRPRGFPMPIPTSPPSQVPAPSRHLLEPILKSLCLEARECTPLEYATSMRALATLANTIMSRTLPIPSIPTLLKRFSSSSTHPAVYPERMVQLPQKDAWAYAASNQVHNALVSLMFSPPNFRAAAALETKFDQDEALPPPTGAAQYALQALGWQSCMVLVQYALVQIRQPRILTRLFEYMVDMFHWKSPEVLNRILFAARKSDPELAQAVQDKMFGGTLIGNPTKTPQPPAAAAAKTSEAMVETVIYTQPGRSLPGPGSPEEMAYEVSDSTFRRALARLPDVTPNEKSVTALLVDLMNGGHYGQLRHVVTILLPFLRVGKRTSNEEIRRIANLTGAQIGASGRIRSTDLSPEVYTIILQAMLRCENVTFAQRVYDLATWHRKDAFTKARTENLARSRGRVDADDELAAAEADKDEPTNPLDRFFPTDFYTSMLSILAIEACHPGPRIPGWRLPSYISFHPADNSAAAHVMGWEVYKRARVMWRQTASLPNTSAAFQPNEDFFSAAVACFFRGWELDLDGPPAAPDARAMRILINDMRDAGIDVPPDLIRKARGETFDGVRRYFFPRKRVPHSKFQFRQARMSSPAPMFKPDDVEALKTLKYTKHAAYEGNSRGQYAPPRPRSYTGMAEYDQ